MYDNEWIFEILDDDLFLVEVKICGDTLTIIRSGETSEIAR